MAHSSRNIELDLRLDSLIDPGQDGRVASLLEEMLRDTRQGTDPGRITLGPLEWAGRCVTGTGRLLARDMVGEK